MSINDGQRPMDEENVMCVCVKWNIIHKKEGHLAI